MKKLSAKLSSLLLQAVGRIGSYNPNDCLFVIEESLTDKEYKTAVAFLSWCHSTQTKFGYNINEIYAKYLAKKKA